MIYLGSIVTMANFIGIVGIGFKAWAWSIRIEQRVTALETEIKIALSSKPIWS